MKVSVIIPHLNQPDVLGRCLKSLMDGRRRPDEIIVVDNGSHARPQDIVDPYPSVRLLDAPEPGPGPARNRGVTDAAGDILAFIDADCFADPGWLEVVTGTFSDPAAEILGGDVRIALRDPTRPTMIEAYESEYAYRMDRYIAREGFTGTGNLAVRREILDAVGPFAGLDVAEDRDWGQRAIRAGYQIRYVPDMRIYHPARPDFASLALKWDRQSAHDFIAAKQRRFGRMTYAAKTLAMGASPLAEIPRVLRSDRISGPRMRSMAFLGLARIRLYRTRAMARMIAGVDPARFSGSWNRG